MKISFLGDFNSPAFEGLTSVTKKIKNHLQKNGFHIVENDMSADFFHIHSGGFLPAIIPQNKAEKSVYSLYSELNVGFFSNIKNLINQSKYLTLRDWKRIFRFLKICIMSTLSTLVPNSIKRYYLGKMKKVIVSTETAKKELRLKNCDIIRIGIDTDKFKNLNKTHSKITAAYFGHSSVQKGFLDVANAFKKTNGIKKAFYFSNPTSFRQEGTEIYGHVKNIVNAYNDCDIIILPYRTVNSAISNPLTLLESMSCGRAIITTNLPHIKEIAGDSAILVDTYSPKQIADAIIRLKNPELRKELGRKARARIIKYYSEKKMLNEYLQLYKNLFKSIRN